MSGPKDFGFEFVLDRLEEFRRRNEAAQRARAFSVEKALMAARQWGANKRAMDDAHRAATVDDDLARRKEAADRALSRVTAENDAQTVPADAEPAHHVEAALAAETMAADVREEKSATLVGWADALGEDVAVKTFAAADVADWNRRVATLPSGESPAFVAEADALAAQARAIHDRAGETQARFDTRNELLRDVIASMQELGYFVSDPQFADPADPASPVVLKAVLGSDVITTTVDLGSMVKSVWDGQEHEHCKGEFFTFMDAMKSRGVVVTPQRDDLRVRPILKQKGANELPRSTGRQAGE